MNTDFRLFKRSNERDAHYYFSFQYRGQRYSRCLETNSQGEAQRRAKLRYKEITEAVLREDYPTLERLKLRSASTATVANLITAYEKAPVDAGASTRAQNVNALRQLLRVALSIEDSAVDGLSVSAINSTAAAAWFTFAKSKSEKADDQADQVSILRSANSRFRQAASLFTPRAIAAYKRDGCYYRTFEEFLGAGELNKFSRLPCIEYNAPSDDVIQSTLTAWGNVEDRNLFLTIGHELAFGLRAGEMAQAKWSWWSTRQGYPVIDGTAEVKNGTAIIQVRALDPWFSVMQARVYARNWRTNAEDFIITGNETERTDTNFRNVSKWMRDLGWETTKTNHALRAFAGSQIAMKYGIYDASSWLRHSSVKVTEGHYTHFVRRWKPTDMDTIPARWASASEVPLLRVMPTP